MAEIIARRNRSSKTHSLGGRKYAYDGTIGSIHYKDAQDTWQNIDNEFLPVAAPWDWEMVKAGYHIRVKEDFTAGQIIEFEVELNEIVYRLQLQPMALEWTNDLDQIQQISMPQNVTPVISNPIVDLLPAVGMPSHQGTARWNDAYGAGIDFEWHCQSTRLAKRLEIANLNNLPVPQQYIIDGGNPVLRLNLIFDPPSKNDVDIVVDGQVWNQTSKAQTFKMIEFVKDGEVLWGFMPLRYWDSGDNEGQSVATLEKRGNKLYISIRVPYNWLQTSIFPIFIDTDIDPQPAQVSASSDDCDRITDSQDFWSLTSSRQQAGAFSAIFYKYGNGMRFQSLSMEGTIDVAYFRIACTRTESGVNSFSKISIEAVDDAPTFADSKSGFDTRWANRTGSVDWDNMPSWTSGTSYNSISIVSVIQAVVDRGGWASGQDIVIFWDDFADRSTHESGSIRRGHSYDSNTSLAPKLHIEYTEVGPTAISVSDVLALVETVTVKSVVSISDALALADTISIVGQVVEKSVTDVLALVDTVTIKSSVSIADALALADASPSIVTSISIADSLSLAEEVYSPPPILTETLALTETVTIVSTVAIADTLALADTVAIIVAVSISDALSLSELIYSPPEIITDTLTLDEIVYAPPPVIADTLTLSETVTVAIAVPVSDVLALAETVAIIVGVTISDVLSLSEAIYAPPETIADTLSLSDAVTISASISVADTLALTDAVSSAISVAVSDILSLAETVTIAAGISISDSLALSDTVYSPPEIITDTLTLDDSVATSIVVSVADALSLAEAVTVIIAVSISDTLTLADVIYSPPPIISDTLTLADTVSVVVAISISDTLTLADSVSSVTIGIPVSVPDVLSLSETVSVIISVSISDDLSLADTITPAPSISVSDLLSLSEVVSVGVALSIADALALSEAVSVGASISISDTLTLSETITGFIKLTISDSLELTEEVESYITKFTPAYWEKLLEAKPLGFWVAGKGFNL